MAAPTSQALAKRTAESALMPPPPPPKRQKRPAIVLEEDEYAQAVSDIIARDYFPGLREAQAQSEYLDALQSNNQEWIREAGRNLAHVMTPVAEHGKRSRTMSTRLAARMTTPCETPRGRVGETPGRTPQAGAQERPTPAVDINMSLSAFQARYTSEDNESFNALLDKQNAQHAAKYAFLHDGNTIPTARQIAHRQREMKLLEQGKITSVASTSTALTPAGTSNSVVARPSQDLDARPASLDSFPNRQGARNHFMFEPEGVDGARRQVTAGAGQGSDGQVRTVTYANTRLEDPHPQGTSDAIPQSPSMSAIDAAIAGRPRPTASEPGCTGAETPRVNGYAFVDAEATSSELGLPVDDAEADAVEHDAAMRLIPKLDKSGHNPFKIAERSDREDLHRRLVEKADAGRRHGSSLAKLRDLGITPGRSLTPKLSSSSSVRRGGDMTPAARRLADRLSTPRRDGGMFQARNDWTPNPRGRRPP